MGADIEMRQFNLAWISDHLQSKVWEEMTFAFPNFNGYTLKLVPLDKRGLSFTIVRCFGNLFIQCIPPESQHKLSLYYIKCPSHYDDVIMSAIASQITSLTIVYSTVYPGADQSKHQSSASLAFVRGINRGPVNSPPKWPVTRKMFPFDDVIMIV